ncbi:hypothetical protein [Kitasatospora sp. NPDC097691]|uniref:hypothetical protein n=1 Tax=Kitasatospora sp. NPDC097691 TaxID=3157231 RepID=UPI00332506D6
MKRIRTAALAALVALATGAGISAAQDTGSQESPLPKSANAPKATTAGYPGTPQTVPPGEDRSAAAHCPAGTVLTGGGGGFDTNPQQVAVVNSVPDFDWWIVTGSNHGSAPADLVAYAVCLTP